MVSMNKCDSRDQSVRGLSLPLCRRYAVGTFSSAITLVRCSEGARERAVHWALGCLRDGECELLGAWGQAGIGPGVPAELLADLEVRGVECIRFVVGSDSEGIGRRLLTRSFGATEIPSIWQALVATVTSAAPRYRGEVACALRAVVVAGCGDAVAAAMTAFERGPWGDRYPQVVARWRPALAQWAPIFALSAPLRRVVLSGDLITAELHGSLVRAIGRHGCFADEAAALDFVASALLRAERQLSSLVCPAGPLPALRAGVLAAGSAVAAPSH